MFFNVSLAGGLLSSEERKTKIYKISTNLGFERLPGSEERKRTKICFGRLPGSEERKRTKIRLAIRVQYLGCASEERRNQDSSASEERKPKDSLPSSEERKIKIRFGRASWLDEPDFRKGIIF
ncbi:unnamed protein product [Rhizophagus irregularis]|nr:unnamed protein product [Rhizophagus irregularis]